jgi:hypothetical protein
MEMVRQGLLSGREAREERIIDVFMHDRCRLRYQADVFWVTEAVGQEQLDALLLADVYDHSVFPTEEPGLAQQQPAGR